MVYIATYHPRYYINMINMLSWIPNKMSEEKNFIPQIQWNGNLWNKWFIVENDISFNCLVGYGLWSEIGWKHWKWQLNGFIMIFFPPCVNEIMGFLFCSILSFRFNDLFFVVEGTIQNTVYAVKLCRSTRMTTRMTLLRSLLVRMFALVQHFFFHFHLICFISNSAIYPLLNIHFTWKIFIPSPKRSLI